MAGKPPEIKILGDASGAKRASKETADALKDVEGAAERAEGALGDLGDETSKTDGKLSRFGDSADKVKGRVGDLGDSLKDSLGPAGELAGGAIDAVTGKVSAMNPALLAAGGAAVGAGAGLAALAVSSVNKLQDLVTTMDNVRNRMGGTLEDTSKLGYAMQRAGVSTDDFEEVMEEWGAGVAANIPKLEAMGVAIARNADGTVNSQKTFAAFLETLRHIPGEAERMRVAQDFVGESAYRLLPALRATSGEFRAWTEAAGDAGAVVDDIDAQNVRELQAATAEVEQAWTRVQLTLARGVMPAVIDAANSFANLADKAASVEEKTGILGKGLQLLTLGSATAVGAIDDLTGSTDEAAAAQVLMRDSTSDLIAESDTAHGTVERLAGAVAASAVVDREAKIAVDAVRDAIREREEAEKSAEDAIRSRMDAVRATTDSEYAMRDAQNAVYDSETVLVVKQHELTEAVNAYGWESGQATVAQRAVDAAARDLEQSYIALALKTADTTIRQQELGGEMLSMEHKKNVQIQALQAVAANLTEGSPVRAALDQYIGRLHAIPTAIETRLSIYQEIAPLNTGSNFNLAGLAEGGPARAHTPVIVGEEGPEIFVPDTSGTVISHDKSFGGGGSSFTGQGITVILNGPVMTDDIPQKLVTALDKALHQYRTGRL